MSEALYHVQLDNQPVEVRFVRNHAARRYILRLQPDGVARLTIPRGGSKAFALQFLEKQSAWLRDQLKGAAPRLKEWGDGERILFRGEEVAISVQQENDERITVAFANQLVRVGAGDSVRVSVESHMRRLAAVELPTRTREFAESLNASLSAVSVRNQRTRWGSCSSRRTISLNWRLIQAPEFVRDYIIVHELMHLQEMNHSDRFWRLVREAFPASDRAEIWLRRNSHVLR